MPQAIFRIRRYARCARWPDTNGGPIQRVDRRIGGNSKGADISAGPACVVSVTRPAWPGGSWPESPQGACLPLAAYGSALMPLSRALRFQGGNREPASRTVMFLTSSLRDVARSHALRVRIVRVRRGCRRQDEQSAWPFPGNVSGAWSRQAIGSASRGSIPFRLAVPWSAPIGCR